MTASERMTKGERDDLMRLIRQREKVAKTAAAQRSAVMLAEFEQQVSALHSFDKNEVWAAAVAAAKAVVEEANEKIDAESAKLGIPEEFRPQVAFHWARRGENEMANRRAELRRAAKTEIEAIEATARAQIEAGSVSAQTEIMSHGLMSDSAKAFLESMAPIEKMMPLLNAEAIRAKIALKARETGHYPYLLE